MESDSAEFYLKAPPDQGASSFVYPPTGPNLEFFADALRAGCLVAIPTETVYGLAALALNEHACRSIFAVKGRPLMDPLIVHIPDKSMAADLAELPECFDAISNAFWPGPLTLVLNKKPIVPDLVTAGKPTVAIRMPKHPVAHQLLVSLGAPLAAPSANPFGYVSPSRAQHVADSFGEKVRFIIDGGKCAVGLESTILDLSKPGAPRILRPGAVSADQIAEVLGVAVGTDVINLDSGQAAPSPGTFPRHYSPSTRLVLFEGGLSQQLPDEEAVLLLRRPAGIPARNVYWLSEDGSLDSAARSLFELLRQLDQLEYHKIHCELPPSQETGLATAIRDRLTRAAAK